MVSKLNLAVCFLLAGTAVASSGCLGGPPPPPPQPPPDVTPPEVSSVSPADAATGVEPSLTPISVVFSEPIREYTGPSAVRVISQKLGTATEKDVGHTLQWANNRTLEVVLSSGLPPGGKVKLTLLSSGYVDLAGNKLVADYQWSFITRDLKLTTQNDRGMWVTGIYNYKVVGEVINGENLLVAGPRWNEGKITWPVLVVIYDFRDSSGRLMINSGSCDVANVGAAKPGARFPFWCQTDDPSKQIASYKLRVDAWNSTLTTLTPYEVALKNVKEERVPIATYRVSGTIDNPGAKQVSVVAVAVTCYRTDGLVFEWNTDTNHKVLDPGTSDAFTVDLSDATNEITTCEELAGLVYP